MPPAPTSDMHAPRQAYHDFLKPTNTSTETKSYNSRFVERTTWLSDIRPPAHDLERTLDWKEFLSHNSRSVHNATTCSYCVRSSGLGPLPVPDVAGSLDTHNDASCSRKQLASPVIDGWSRCRSVLYNILRFRVGARVSSLPVLRSVRDRRCRSIMIDERAPVLPPLGRFAPLFEGFELWVCLDC